MLDADLWQPGQAVLTATGPRGRTIGADMLRGIQRRIGVLILPETSWVEPWSAEERADRFAEFVQSSVDGYMNDAGRP